MVGNTKEAEGEVQQERVIITLRPLNMQDFKEAKNQVNNIFLVPIKLGPAPIIKNV